MSKMDSLKEEIGLKKIYLDKFILIAITLITGIVTVIYQVLSGKVPLYMLLVIGAGFIVLGLLIDSINKANEYIEKKIEELKNV